MDYDIWLYIQNNDSGDLKNMAIPVLFIYAVGVMAFILGLEAEDNKIMYLGIAFFVNIMAYYLSYSSTDYTQAAYLPLVITLLTVVMIFWTAWNMIPISKSWDLETDRED